MKEIEEENKRHLFRCPACGKRVSVPNTFCKSCQARQSKGSTYTPQKNLEGENKRDYRGNFICKFCGLSFKSLNIHLKKAHNISMKEYVIKFDIQEQYKKLNRGTGKKLKLEQRRRWAERSREKEKPFYAMRVLKRHKNKIKGSDKYCL